MLLVINEVLYELLCRQAGRQQAYQRIILHIHSFMSTPHSNTLPTSLLHTFFHIYLTASFSGMDLGIRSF